MGLRGGLAREREAIARIQVQVGYLPEEVWQEGCEEGRRAQVGVEERGPEHAEGNHPNRTPVDGDRGRFARLARTRSIWGPSKRRRSSQRRKPPKSELRAQRSRPWWTGAKKKKKKKKSTPPLFPR